MLLSLKTNRNHQGFTAIEIMVVVLIIGILAAIAIPSFLAMNNKVKLNYGLSSLRASIEEAQRKAIRTSKDCPVTLPTTGTSDPTVNSPCLIAGNLTLHDVTMRNNFTSVTFNYRGDTATSTAIKGTIVLSMPNQLGEQKCLVISPGIGLIRTGNYAVTDTTGTDPNNCAVAQ